tara:strand:+ start:586 stop:1014 length:429 start_codon:yes stop_codon:yes gene_type:complete
MEEKYLYFRTVTDQDDNDGIDDSIYVKASSITGMFPTSATAITIFFESVKNQESNSNDDEVVISDSVIINHTAGLGKQVLQTIVRAINSTAPLYNDGVITVADDVTTTYLTSTAGADETVSAQYIDGGITSCGAITIAAALT